MAPQTADLNVQIVRFVLDHQPPIVACELVDADGHRHTFIHKVWIFSEQTLDAQTEYPQPGIIRCTVLETWPETGGRELVRINTAHPDQIESTDGLSEFTVLRKQLSVLGHKSPPARSLGRQKREREGLEVIETVWWRRADSNRGPRDYETLALAS